MRPLVLELKSTRGVNEMTTAERNHEWLPWKLFIIGIALTAAGWIALFALMAFWPV